MMDFAAAQRELEHLGLEVRPGAKFDLAHMRALLAGLGNPERRWAALHIAGTNGKGSVAALAESALRAGGRRVGLYTSPHLERVTERVRVGGAELSEDAFTAAYARTRAAVERLLAEGDLPHPPSFFETLTALGFIAFAAADIEVGVVEVGMGGRLDATNVLAPRAAAITPIGFDHEKFLGPTLAAIAGEKAGVIKPGLRVVMAAQAAEAEAVLRAAAAARGAEIVPPVPLRSEPRRDAEGRYSFRLGYAGAEVDVKLALRGRHQVENARVAARLCELLGEAPGEPGRPAPAALASGLAVARWPGRLEKISDQPPVYLDGAHNPPAAAALAAFLDEMGWRPVLIYGSLRDKAVGEISEILFPRARRVILCAPQNPRALSVAALAEQAATPVGVEVERAPDLAAALARARALACAGAGAGATGGKSGGEAAPILIAGSLYLVGEARSALGEARSALGDGRRAPRGSQSAPSPARG